MANDREFRLNRDSNQTTELVKPLSCSEKLTENKTGRLSKKVRSIINNALWNESHETNGLPLNTYKN